MRINLKTPPSLRKLFLSGLREITFIFIGITSAIWFDNWNEERQDRVFEKEILQSIAAELSVTISVWEQFIEHDNRATEALAKVLASLRENKSSLGNPFLVRATSSFHTYHVESSSFETLKGKGFEVIRDLKVRQAVINIYTNQFEFAREINQQEALYQINQMRPFIDKWIRLKAPENPDQWFPFDASGEWVTVPDNSKDKEPINFLNNRLEVGFFHRQQLGSIIDDMKNLIADIKDIPGD